jgi:uncharacterized membrane protein YciS (DUF1049 family)
MRLIYLLFLVIVIAAIAVFAVQNDEWITLKFINYTKEAPLSALLGIGYGLGMLSGWSVVGMVRRSWQGVTQPSNR